MHGYPALSVLIPAQWFDIYWAFIDPAHEGPGFRWGSSQTPWEVQSHPHLDWHLGKQQGFPLENLH